MISTRTKLSAPWKRRLKTMPRGILKRPNGPLKLAPLYIRAVLTIPLTRTEKQGFKARLGTITR